MHGWRFRLRIHMAPRILWSTDRVNVINNFMAVRNCEMVNRETLADLKELQERQMRINEPYAYVKFEVPLLWT